MINFNGLRTALEKFQENGKYSKCGKWGIINGGYDLWWEPIAEFTEETEKRLIEKVKSIYADL